MHLVIPHLLIRVLLWSRSMGCCYFRSWRRIKGWEHIGKALHWMYVFWIIVGECCSIYCIDSQRQCQFRLETSMAVPPRERNGEQPCTTSKQLDRYCLRRLLLHQGRCPVSNTFVVTHLKIARLEIPSFKRSSRIVDHRNFEIEHSFWAISVLRY